MAGLLVYLAGAGRANEHTEPHLVAALRALQLEGQIPCPCLAPESRPQAGGRAGGDKGEAAVPVAG